MTVDLPRAEAAIRELLIAVGEDPDRDGLEDTPQRVAKSYDELLAGLDQTPEDVLTAEFDVGHDELVLVKDIEMWSMCEHHLVPFFGVAHVGYIPPRAAGSRGCPSWPGSSTSSPAARRCRSGSRRRSPTRSSSTSTRAASSS